MAEIAKIREHAPRIKQLEHVDFMPLVFTCAGGIAPKSCLLLKKLAELISEKQKVTVAQVSGLLRELRFVKNDNSLCSRHAL